MTLAELLPTLFPDGHTVSDDKGLLSGSATLRTGGHALVIGVAGRTPLGVDGALFLAGHVLKTVDPCDDPIIVIVDSDSQRMTKRDELLGLNEFLAHLAKTLLHADMHGRPTIGLLHGHSAAGAFLATALATRVLVAIRGAEPAVMDLASIARVTKLPLDVLEEKAKATPVFAPGLDNLARTGAVHAIWDAGEPLADRLASLLVSLPDMRDRRDELGKQRGGRTKAFEIARRVQDLATAGE